MSRRLFLLFQDSKIAPKKTAFETSDCFSLNSADVLLIGFFFVQAINHKEAKTDWPKFFIYYAVLCIASLAIYLIIQDH